MSDPLSWSPIRLGRWLGTTYRVHILLIVFVAFHLSLNTLRATSIEQSGRGLLHTACWMILLLAALAIHELAHAVTASWLASDQDDVRIWPLGNMVGPTPIFRPREQVWISAAGPAMNISLALGIAVALQLFWGAQFVWKPFGLEKSGIDVGAPLLAGQPAAPLTGVWFLGWFGYLNYVLALANIFPALPFDGGRMFRAYLASTSVVSTRDDMYAPMTARATAAVLFLSGLAQLVFYARFVDGITLVVMAVIVERLVRSESRMLDDDGYFEDGVFGYDFSEGYTSLEGSAAKVRPYRESALKRWRRRRSELRRERRMMREAAEERRMDEILDKLHREGRAALTEEEHHFLVRVSTRYRNRSRSQE